MERSLPCSCPSTLLFAKAKSGVVGSVRSERFSFNAVQAVLNFLDRTLRCRSPVLILNLSRKKDDLKFVANQVVERMPDGAYRGSSRLSLRRSDYEEGDSMKNANC